MSDLPTGTLTFLFSDVEGSTALWDRAPEAMGQALARHDELIEACVAAQHGQVVRPRGEGDSRFAVFQQAEAAVAAAVAIQQGLAGGFADLPFGIQVRIGLHTGSADLRLGDYYGSTVNRCARIRGLGHGGQTLLSQVTAELVRDRLPAEVGLLDLGQHPLKGLSRAETIFHLAIPGLPDDFPPLKSAAPEQTNLPVPPTRFVGRQRQLAEVVARLQQPGVRLLTLTGPGGTGKTRLSLEAGRALLGHFVDGVYFVDLAPLSDPALAGTTIARTLGIREGGGRPPLDNLLDYLADKALLLIFDNFEQITAAAPVVAQLLAAAPRCKVLATSRGALQLRGEHELPLAPLELPADESRLSLDQLQEVEAVALFVQQARAVQPGFALTPANAAAVVGICRRLDGLPLAIEIAAARLKLLPPAALLKRLDNSLQVLVGGALDLPARHQTLRDTIAWSYDLLKPAEQQLFGRLSVFVGGFSLESAESVCNPQGDLDGFAAVEGLFNNSLLLRVESVTGEPRFSMLQTIREFALEKLAAGGDLPEWRRSHAEYFAGQAETLGNLIYGAEAVDNLARLDEEYANFRAEISYFLETEGGLAGAMLTCVMLVWFWYRYGHFNEGRAWSERVLAAAQHSGSPRLLAVALYTNAMLAMWEGDLDIAAQRSEQAIRLIGKSGEDLDLSFANLGFGAVLLNQGRDREAHAHLVEAAELYDQLGYAWHQGSTLVHLANAALGLGEFERARAWLDQAMPIIRSTGDAWQLAFGLNNYGELARAQGDYAAAEGYYRQTEAAYQAADAQGDRARLIHTFGYLALHRDEIPQAKAAFLESLADFRRLGNRRGMVECLAGLAAVAARQDQAGWAAPLLSAAQALLTASGGSWWPADRMEVDQTLARLRAALGAEQFAALWETGQKMSLEQAVGYAVEGMGDEG